MVKNTTKSVKKETKHTNKNEKSHIEHHEFGAQTSKILQLMIHSLYAHKDIFLRELVSNASDACDKIRYEALTNPNLLKDNSEFGIQIITNSQDKTLTICDNGIGMNKNDLIQHLGTIASSGTQQFADHLTGNKEKDIQLIGQFGVGFYSSFMVADHVTVITQKAGDTKAWQWDSAGDGHYDIRPYSGDTPIGQGTQIILHLKEDQEQFLDHHRITHIIKTYSDHISFPITLSDHEGKSTETINTGAALWTRPKTEINDEQYHDFYKHISHAGDKPWLTLHNKVEGTLQYTSLLFIPSSPPFDLFHPDRLTRVKLYVKRVFIAEENIDLIPKYLRFLRGIVDSEDLPLNISRETLQHNHTIHKIRNNLVKKILTELNKKAKNDVEAFTQFWKNFGAILKEGLCEAVDANREALLEVCHFYSSKYPEKLITLDQYIEEMPSNQSKIYYALGDSITALQNSPQLEGFIKKGINVILLTDHVDDFWVNTMHEYKGKDFISVTRSGHDIDHPSDENAQNDTKQSSDTKQNKSQKNALPTEAVDKLIAFMKEALKGKILDVKASKKLTSSPVCLTVQEGGMDMRMERFLINQKQLASPSLKILEINPDHAVIKYLATHLDNDQATELSELLFDQACIIEGEPIYDTTSFIKRFNHFLHEALH